MTTLHEKAFPPFVCEIEDLGESKQCWVWDSPAKRRCSSLALVMHTGAIEETDCHPQPLNIPLSIIDQMAAWAESTGDY